MSANLFSFFRDELKLSGHTVLTLSDVSALAAIETFCNGLKQYDDTACQAAAVAITFPHADLGRLEKALGKRVADIVRRLREGPRGGTMDLIYHAARIVRDEGLGSAAAAALAAVAGELVIVPDRSATLKIIADAELTIEKIPEAYREAFGAATRENGPNGEAKDNPQEQKWIVSISIDIARSTEAKTRMLALAPDETHRQGIYQRFYRAFLNKEDRYYQKLFAKKRPDGSPSIDWRRLFVVKGIGDEIWLLYELPAKVEELQHGLAGLLEAALWQVTETVDWSETEKDNGPGFDSATEEAQRADGMRLPFKFHMDLIEDAAEISQLRATEITKNVRNYLSDPSFGPDHVLLSNRLAGGFVETSGRATRIAWRTDYIGHDVDRFFRTSKAALPAIVTIGESLFKRAGILSELAAHPGLFSAKIECEPGLASSLRGMFYLQHDIPSDELKGIGYSYRVYHFTTRYVLNGLHHDTFASPEVIEPTRARFPDSYRKSLQTLAERQREHEERDVEDGATASLEPHADV